mmetsp:Transcript_16638/g.34622  ORF Transcript_16638/g.34622 Transcript_16638/m.34622 type:complete len:80 (-) Transcript_16638:1068-1307(-)
MVPSPPSSDDVEKSESDLPNMDPPRMDVEYFSMARLALAKGLFCLCRSGGNAPNSEGWNASYRSSSPPDPIVLSAKLPS